MATSKVAENQPIRFVLISLAIGYIFLVGYLILDGITPLPMSETDRVIDLDMPTKSNFFMLETGNGTVKMPDLCALESLSRQQPNSKIFFYHKDATIFNPATEGVYRDLLGQLTNVQFELVNFSRVFENTPLDSWYEYGKYKKSPFSFTVLSDAFRLARLYKHGGIYLDRDIIILKPLDTLPSSSLGFQRSQSLTIGNSFMIFKQAKNPFLLNYLRNFTTRYDTIVGSNGPRPALGPFMITRLLLSECPALARTNISENASCKGVDILPCEVFYGVDGPLGPRLFFDSSRVDAGLSLITNATVGVHWWGNYALNKNKLEPEDGCLYERLAMEHCPMTYEIMRRFEGNYLRS